MKPFGLTLSVVLSILTVPHLRADNKPPSMKEPALLVAPFVESQARAARKKWAQSRQIDEEQNNSVGLQLVLIPAGRFSMGRTESADDLRTVFPHANTERLTGESPAHQVTISRPFYLGKYEVTKGQFQQFVEETDHKTDAEKDGKGGWGYDSNKDPKKSETPFYVDSRFTWRQLGFDQSDESPVVNVSHNDATAFCEWLSKKEGKQYRLPTEAEWEYACRAGTMGRYYNGDDPEASTKIGNVADATAKEQFPWWQNTLSTADGWPFSSPKGRFRPNNFGLYDMSGNAWEWCSDWYDVGYYAKSPERDPQGPASGLSRAYRGGSWYNRGVHCQSAHRSGGSPAGRGGDLGFRLARSLSGK